MPSYTNMVTDCRLADIAIEQVLIGPYGTATYNGSARIDIDDPSTYSGYTFLGPVVEDSPSLEITREFDRLETGRPRTLQCLDLQSIAGTFTIALYSSSNRQVQYALGNVYPLNKTTNLTTIAAGGGGDPSQITVATSPGWAVGDYIITAGTTTEMTTTGNEAKITSIVGSASTWDVYFSPSLPDTPSDGDYAAHLLGSQLPYGTAIIREFSVLGIADFPRGVQVVHEFPKAQSAGEFTETYSSEERAQIELTFELMTTTTTKYTGTSQLILGERHFWNEV